MQQQQEDSDSIPVKIFYFYSDKEYEREEEAKQRLDQQLALLQNDTHIHLTDSHVIAGYAKDEIIERHLNQADIIVLLISSDFMTSNYCIAKAQIALDRHHQEKALVIPVLFRPIYMMDVSFNNLQMLPLNEKPITSWENKDEACAEVVRGIGLAIKAIRLKREALLTIADADKLFLQQNYAHALSSYRSAWSRLERTSFNKSIVHILWHMGNAHSKLKHYEEALEAYDKAIAIDPQIEFYKEKSNVLLGLGLNKEVIEACDAAISLIKSDEEQSVVAQIYVNKGIALARISASNTILARNNGFKRALVDFERALSADDNNVMGWRWKGMLHDGLGEGEEAKNAYLKAIALQPDDASLRNLYADLLRVKLQDFAEALIQYSKAIKLDGNLKPSYKGRMQASSALAAELEQKAKELRQSAEEDKKQF